MREIIRYAWGISSLGNFVVAMSEKGIVALEFSSMRPAMEYAFSILVGPKVTGRRLQRIEKQ